MSFPRYPAYKDSGVEWLGEVPEHWELKKLKHCILRLGSGGTPESSNPEFWADHDSEGSIPWVAIGDMSAVLCVTSTAKSLSPLGLSSRSLEIFPSGSLLYSIYASLGKVAILGIDAAFNQAILAILPNTQSASQPFLRYWLESLERHLEYYASSNTQANLNAAKVLNYPVSVPSLCEQHAIATFLDRETAKIDALIAEQQRLIELLQEKRQAVISHAVTKGLNPHAPMKDSGVEWLGEVPEHWSVTTIKRVVSTPVTDGPHETPEFLDEGIPFVSAEAVSRGTIDFERIRGFISIDDHNRYSQKYCPRRDDIFMVKSGATTGTSAIVETDIEFNIWSPLAVIRCGPEALPRFVLHFIRSRNFLEAVALGWSFGTQQNIGMGVIENLGIVVPPLEEQRQIISLLECAAGEANLLIVEAERSIVLLQERRSALISAAVTGQIDVRGLAPETSAA